MVSMSTTIKVPNKLHDRLAEHARIENITLADVIAHSLDTAEAAAFWDEIRTTMGTERAESASARIAEGRTGSMSDGLDPDEDWSDVL